MIGKKDHKVLQVLKWIKKQFKKGKSLFSVHEPILKHFHDMRQRGVLHVFHGQPLRLEGSVRSQIIRDLKASLPGEIICYIFEEIYGTDEFAIGHLEAGSYDSGRAVEASGMGGLEGTGHERAVVAAAHPSRNKVTQGKGL
jgi:hypothetical protein